MPFFFLFGITFQRGCHSLFLFSSFSFYHAMTQYVFSSITRFVRVFSKIVLKNRAWQPSTIFLFFSFFLFLFFIFHLCTYWLFFFFFCISARLEQVIMLNYIAVYLEIFRNFLRSMLSIGTEQMPLSSRLFFFYVYNIYIYIFMYLYVYNIYIIHIVLLHSSYVH